eukprot:UN04514
MYFFSGIYIQFQANSLNLVMPKIKSFLFSIRL